MKLLSTARLAETIKKRRDAMGLTQEKLASLTGINRIMIGRIEHEKFIPSIRQLEALAKTLGFDIEDVFVEEQRSNSFVALRGEARTDEERMGVDTLLTSMLTLRQQILLRRKLEHARMG
jgi:transcriptional regulator with XRE-family HTH domain